jgi:acyl dehydratase
MTTEQVDDLIDPRARELIGVELAVTQGVVVKRDFQRFAAAVKDRNPLYFDAEYAQANGYRDVICPPMYLSCITLGVFDLDAMRPDGIPLNNLGKEIPLPKTPRRMAGGETVTFHEPIYDGDVITATRVLESIEQKQGRSGSFILVSSRVRYTRADGTVVAEATLSTIYRP